MTIDFSVGKCKTRAGYSAILRKKQALNLKGIKNKFEVVMETPILLVIKVKEIEVIVHSYGELLFKDCNDVPLMEEIAEEVFETGLKNQ